MPLSPRACATLQALDAPWDAGQELARIFGVYDLTSSPETRIARAQQGLSTKTY